MSLFETFRLFQKLSEFKSFSKVAESEQVHVSSVSRRIEALEAELGVSLFVRTTRSVSLTPAGRIYLERVQNLLAGFEEAKKESDAQLATPKGGLKIAAPVTFSRLYLAPLLARFHESYPEIRLTLVSSNDYVDLIQDEIDLAIRIGNLKDSSMISKRLAPATYTLCASPPVFSQAKAAHASIGAQGSSLPHIGSGIEGDTLVLFARLKNAVLDGQWSSQIQSRRCDRAGRSRWSRNRALANLDGAEGFARRHADQFAT